MAKKQRYRLTRDVKIATANSSGKWYKEGETVDLDLQTAQCYHRFLDPDPGPRPLAPPAAADSRLADWMARQLAPEPEEDEAEADAEPEASSESEPEAEVEGVESADETADAEAESDEPEPEEVEAAEEEPKPKPKPRRRRSRAKKS